MNTAKPLTPMFSHSQLNEDIADVIRNPKNEYTFTLERKSDRSRTWEIWITDDTDDTILGRYRYANKLKAVIDCVALQAHSNVTGPFVNPSDKGTINLDQVISLAKQFAFELRRNITASDFEIVLKNNRDYNNKSDSDVCGSHDVCDANVYMNNAFKKVTGHDCEVQSEEDTALWNAAWSLSKEAEFFSTMEIESLNLKKKKS